MVSRGQLTPLLGLHRELRAVALRAKMNVTVGIELEVVAAGNVVQPPFLDLEIFRCCAERSHHRADVEICHGVLLCGSAKGSGHRPASRLDEATGGLAWNEHRWLRGVPCDRHESAPCAA